LARTFASPYFGRKPKIKVATANVVVNEWFYYKYASHNKNEKIYTRRKNESVFNLVQFGTHASSKKKLIQFTNIFRLLSHAQPMIKFKMFKNLYGLLRLKNNPRKYWIKISGWGMAKSMHDVMLENTKIIMQKFGFFALSANKQTTINNQQWINVHIYVMKKWVQIPILLTF
jgi:hypothetical protein